MRIVYRGHYDHSRAEADLNTGVLYVNYNYVRRRAYVRAYGRPDAELKSTQSSGRQGGAWPVVSQVRR